MTPNPIYDTLEAQLANWAAARPDALALVMIGSRARADRPADEWSDLDTILFTTDPELYLPGLDWQADLEARFGLPVWFAAHSRTDRGDLETEWVLQDGVKVDMVFLHSDLAPEAPATLQNLIDAAPYRNVFAQGTRALYESIPAAQPLRLAERMLTQRPDQAEFDNRIANVLLDLTRAMKLARRGELWRAARAVNDEVQAHLLYLLEWQAALRPEPVRDLRYGRFLETWADAGALAALPAAHADCTLNGVRGAVHAALDLLEWLAPEVARLAGLSYNLEAIRPSADWLRSL